MLSRHASWRALHTARVRPRHGRTLSAAGSGTFAHSWCRPQDRCVAATAPLPSTHTTALSPPYIPHGTRCCAHPLVPPRSQRSREISPRDTKPCLRSPEPRSTTSSLSDSALSSSSCGSAEGRVGLFWCALAKVRPHPPSNRRCGVRRGDGTPQPGASGHINCLLRNWQRAERMAAWRARAAKHDVVSAIEEQYRRVCGGGVHTARQ